ncbi:MAG TPA: Asp-tRNA(Asn)/Glu-tRNA(Gln) amidotransferase subunit GatC [Abditibacteriaceae bacterium]|jgi:aspartyl-tRNA(Asn)/glutamyl-tRNA(Gln) amidotransferase subunit C
MSLTPEEVDHIALLARLDLSAAERERAGRELSQILDHFQQLSELDTTDVEPTSHVFPVVNVLREDRSRPSLPRNEVLLNAPEQADGMFQVPRVVEAD